MSDIQVFNHHAMAAQFQVRIAGGDAPYAAQVAHAAFALLDGLESRLSRFRVDSEISQLARLAAGEKLRLSEPVFACLKIARQMETATLGAFSITAAALKTQPAKPSWSLVESDYSVRCERGKVEIDLGAIGKGFALDRLAELLREWSCRSFLLVAGGSSILAGEPPAANTGWSCGLGEDNSPVRYLLKNCSLSGSGLAVKGPHIIDPRTGLPGSRRERAWALAETAAESDALSTACMILEESEIQSITDKNSSWLVMLRDDGRWRHLGRRPLPEQG